MEPFDMVGAYQILDLEESCLFGPTYIPPIAGTQFYEEILAYSINFSPVLNQILNR